MKWTCNFRLTTALISETTGLVVRNVPSALRGFVVSADSQPGLAWLRFVVVLAASRAHAVQLLLTLSRQATTCGVHAHFRRRKRCWCPTTICRVLYDSVLLLSRGHGSDGCRILFGASGNNPGVTLESLIVVIRPHGSLDRWCIIACVDMSVPVDVYASVPLLRRNQRTMVCTVRFPCMGRACPLHANIRIPSAKQACFKNSRILLLDEPTNGACPLQR